MSKRKPIVQTNTIDAYYVGDDSDGAYYQVAKSWKGWYVTVWVDGAWTGDLATDKGPWKTGTPRSGFVQRGYYRSGPFMFSVRYT